MKFKNIAAIICMAIAPNLSFAQTKFLPVDPTASSTSAKPNASSANIVVKNKGALSLLAEVKGIAGPVDKPAIFPECTSVPTVTDLPTGFTAQQVVMSRNAALKLGLPVGNGSLIANQMVLVQDYSRSKECLATDGKSRLLYGQTIRTVITISNMETQANLSLPAVAANATIAGKSNSVKIDVLGFNNSKMTEAASKIFGKELNVESFGLFSGIQAELVGLIVAPETSSSVERLGVVTADSPNSFGESVATAYALQLIKDGKSCTQAKSSYKDGKSLDANIAIEQVYAYLSDECKDTAPTGVARARATEYLGSVRIR